MVLPQMAVLTQISGFNQWKKWLFFNVMAVLYMHYKVLQNIKVLTSCQYHLQHASNNFTFLCQSNRQLQNTE